MYVCMYVYIYIEIYICIYIYSIDILLYTYMYIRVGCRGSRLAHRACGFKGDVRRGLYPEIFI